MSDEKTENEGRQQVAASKVVGKVSRKAKAAKAPEGAEKVIAGAGKTIIYKKVN